MEKINFEESMKELQDVVNKLEKGNLTLDESIEEFQKGIKLSPHFMTTEKYMILYLIMILIIEKLNLHVILQTI